MSPEPDPGLYSTASIPEGEVETLIGRIRSHPEYRSTVDLCERYQALGLEVLADPFGRDVPDRVRQALRTGTPYSVIRMGDGEMNLLSFGAYPDTPNLDRCAARATIRANGGSFGEDELWVLAVREMMMSAVLQADVVGVLGLWRARPASDVEHYIKRLRRSLLGYTGYWRGMDYMLTIARTGSLRNKVVASAHLYFGLLRHLDEILADAERILLITDRASVVEALRRKHPDRPIQYISASKRAEKRPTEGPHFLQETAAQLPPDLRRCCCLVGAGPWSEVYCTWIKQRGGVGLDLGSGFDLMAGTISRPIHRHLGLQEANPYSL